jgi:hypothetical protein
VLRSNTNSARDQQSNPATGCVNGNNVIGDNDNGDGVNEDDVTEDEVSGDKSLIGRCSNSGCEHAQSQNWEISKYATLLRECCTVRDAVTGVVLNVDLNVDVADDVDENSSFDWRSVDCGEALLDINDTVDAEQRVWTFALQQAGITDDT